MAPTLPRYPPFWRLLTLLVRAVTAASTWIMERRLIKFARCSLCVLRLFLYSPGDFFSPFFPPFLGEKIMPVALEKSKWKKFFCWKKKCFNFVHSYCYRWSCKLRFFAMLIFNCSLEKKKTPDVVCLINANFFIFVYF